ncbi:hypothetical protein BBP40_006637 [Aspergillus hancockii]|nr:hypothetical protein BBP40_006637 [Aspergillus hancockii]
MVGGAAQAYATVEFCTCMKTAEITRHKQAAAGLKPPGALQAFLTMLRTDGLRGINKGVNAIAIRQVTNWGSRFGFSRLVVDTIRKVTEKERDEKLGVIEKILASGVGGALASWNQPIDVVRVEMQSLKAVGPQSSVSAAPSNTYIPKVEFAACTVESRHGLV